MLGGPIIAGATLSRFFALHVVCCTRIAHCFRRSAPSYGVENWESMNGYARTRRPRATYLQEYHELTHKQVCPSYLTPCGKIYCSPVSFFLRSLPARFILGLWSGWPARSTIIQTAPRPRLLLFVAVCIASFLPPSARHHTADWSVVGIIILLVLPLVAGEGEKSWKRRPIAVLAILLLAVALGTLTHFRGTHPLEPGDGRLEQPAIPSEYLKSRTNLERRGALVFSGKTMPQLSFAR